LFLIRKRIEIYNAKKLSFENKLKTNLLFDEEAISAGSEIEASVVLLLRNAYGRVLLFACERQ
jgi:hypothetical protein